MKDWKTVKGTQVEIPLELDLTSSPTTVYQRKDIVQVEEDTANGEGTILVWQYQERELTRAEYESMMLELESPAIQAIREENLVTMQAQAETYEKQLQLEENQLIMMAAIAELYETQTTPAV